MVDARQKFLEVYVSLPFPLRKEIIVVVEGEPISWIIAYKEIKAETGCKGKDLFRPLRVALTTKTSGLDLDKFIPLVEEGARLVFPKPMLNCALRISKVIDHIKLK